MTLTNSELRNGVEGTSSDICSVLCLLEVVYYMPPSTFIPSYV